MCIAKAIGGGFPLGACLATEDAAIGMVAGTHGSTYGGNPLAMAVGIAALDLITEVGFLDNVVKTGMVLQAKLDQVVKANPKVFVELRGEGLMLGLRCADDVVNGSVVTALQKAGMLTVGASENVIRLLPPLIIGDAEIDLGAETLNAVAAEIAATSGKA
jgi:acetylornithine/N-succinyldiaminopimelate aminotransferase